MDSSTVLVVDDEITSRFLLRMLLETAGYTVVEAEDGIVALEMVDEHQPHAMILDVMMPKLDGISVCKMLRARKETAVLPIIALSGGNYEEESLAAGANTYMEKPMSADYLFDTLAKYTKREYLASGLV